MTTYFDAIKSHLESHNLPFQVLQGSCWPYFEVFYPTPGTLVRLLIDQDEEDGWVKAHLILPTHVPEKARLEVVRYLNWLNYTHILVGNFEMDIRDGEIRFRNNMDIEGSPLTDRMVYNLLANSISRVIDYHGDIMTIAFGERSADEIITRREAEDAEDEPLPTTPATPALTH